MEGSPISVLVAEASRMHCQLLATALKRSRYGFEVVAAVSESQEALRALIEKKPHVAVVGSNLNDGSFMGFKVLRELQVSHSKGKVIMLVERPERDIVIEAFRRGAHGVISQDESFETLCKCMYVVYGGQVWVGSQELHFLIEALAESARPRILDAKGIALLTKKEEGVVRLVAEGLTNRDIARQLDLSENTVRNYVFRIFEKLGTSNRVELALYALHQRIADREPLLGVGN